ncbi:MAG: phage terminase large subunit [Pseudomonadota bacterium]
MIVRSPYGWRDVRRSKGDVLQPSLVSRETLEALRAASPYNFAAQFQQNPEPEAGFIVKRDWVRFYTPEQLPKSFDMVFQSWDTANKDTELADYSVCTTWGLTSSNVYLLHVYRDKPEFPDLKRAVRQLAREQKARVVLIEDKASGTQLIQELRAEQFQIVQAAPAMGGDKIMRLRSQTAKIEGGFVLFPQHAPWLPTYLHEMLSFPNGKKDDQVDSTVFALAWITENPRWTGWTKESLEGLERFTNSLWWEARFWAHARR